METTSVLCLFFFAFSFSSPVIFANELSLAVAKPTKLHISPRLRVEKSPGSKPGSVVLCERIQIHGLSRLKNLRKFAHTVKVEVSSVSSSTRLPKIEVCFHRNFSLGIGMCPQGQWEKLVKDSWIQSMSPFDNKFLDVRVAGSFVPLIQVSIIEEFFLYRISFLGLGVILMVSASSLSKSLVFYYSSAMAIGVILVILMVLFQGMKLLPTGRKSSLAIYAYSSLVGLGFFLLRYLPRLLRSVLAEIGISEDMYNPLAIFLVVFLVITGAWLGFWVVRKLVLTEDGLIDVGASNFVVWSIRFIAAAMILQSSEDPLLAAVALLCGIFISFLSRRITRSRFIRHFFMNLHRRGKSKRRYESPASPPLQDSYDECLGNIQEPDNFEFLTSRWRPFAVTSCATPLQGLTRTPPSQPSDSGTFYSSFHKTPERRKLSKGEWEKFTKDSTKKALEDLVSSPDFGKWAVAHADRITLSPPNKDTPRQRRGWLHWF